jgi:diadenosine tetraphosphatase ApaH/serine/threonine PP2A family protein phosphatase
LSATDIGRTPGQFFWSDETPVDRSTWSTDAFPQPDDFGAGKKACVFLHSEFATLFDAGCAEINYILCEIPAVLSLRF